MDRFKFRAYPTEINSDKTVYEDWQDTTLVEAYGFNGGTLYDVVQFTGLKDIHGQAIYQGDIVKWGHISGSYENPVRVAVVEINPDIQFRLTNGKHTFHFGRFIYTQTERALEVIGNIHQNPELL